MGSQNRNWHRRWTLSADKLTATHETGLVARLEQRKVVIDEASRDIAYAALMSDPDIAPHANARLAHLLQEAQRLFSEPKYLARL